MTALRVLGVFVVLVVAASVGLYVYDHHDATPSPSTTSTTTSSTSTSTTTTTSTTVATAACTGGDFTGSLGSGGGAAGTVFVTATLTNSSGAACTIDGWPTVTLLSGSTSLKAHLIDSSSEFSAIGGVPSTPQPLTIASGGTAQFAFAFSSVPAGAQTSCPSATTVLLTIGSSTSSSSLDLTDAGEIAPCGLPPSVWVSPLYS